MRCFLEGVAQDNSYVIEIYDFEDENYANVFLSNFAEEIESAGLSPALINKSCGFFESVEDTKAQIKAEMFKRIQQKFGYELCFHFMEENKSTVSKSFVTVNELIEEIMDDAYGYIITGSVILIMVRNFLLNGKWHAAIREPSGSLIQKNLKRENYERGNPIIWFGLEGELPLPCWTISGDTWLGETQPVYTTAGDGPAQIENWKIFWHEVFWTLDWTQLLNGKGDVYTTWMFAECGMDEPNKEFEKVKNSCPIDLINIDNFGELTSQLKLYFEQTFSSI